MTHSNPLRWRQRFENFERAFLLLREGMERLANGGLDDLAREGLIQRFEFTFELSWKTLKDYLEHEGVILEQATPRATIKAAFSSRLIPDGGAWIEMLEHRNLLSHTYDEKRFNEALKAVREKYLTLFDHIYMFLKERALEPNT